jgi:hypothetical protein
LKRGRATDVLVGQTPRYMGYVTEQVAEAGQTVERARHAGAGLVAAFSVDAAGHFTWQPVDVKISWCSCLRK